MSLRDVSRMRGEMGGGGGDRPAYMKDLRMDDKDVVRGFFLHEPEVKMMHRVVNVGGRKFGYEACSKTSPDDPTPCGWCTANIQGSVKVNRASPRALFTFRPVTLFHMVPVLDKKGTPLTTRKGDPIFNEIPCKGKGCKMCQKKGNEAVAVDNRRFEIAIMYAEVLALKVDELSQFAQEGWAADEDQRVPINRLGWACENCGAKFKEVSYTTEQFLDRVSKKCPKCDHEAPLLERLEAEGIENPTRVNLLSGIWKITRMGKDKGTTFTFDFVKVAAPPEDAFENIMDFSAFYTPRSPRKVEELLGGEMVSRPLARGTGGTSYNEEEEDETEEDEEPRRPAKQGPVKKGIRF